MTIPEDSVPLEEVWERYEKKHLDPWLKEQPAVESLGMEDQTAWWQKYDCRKAEALAYFIKAAETNEFRVLYGDPPKRVPSRAWKEHQPFAGVVSSVECESVSEGLDDGLSKYNGQELYVREREAEAWLRRLSGFSDVQKVPSHRKGGPPCKHNWSAFKNDIKEVLRHHGGVDPTDPELPTKASLTNKIVDEWSIRGKWGAAGTPVKSTLQRYTNEAIAEYEAEKADN